MPTYTYICTDCEKKYDAFQSMKEDSHTVCPDCNGTVQRMIGAGAGILFKGSGFYVTDYKSGTSAGSSGTKSTVDTGSTSKVSTKES